jgi:FkbM family methyltransferase
VAPGDVLASVEGIRLLVPEPTEGSVARRIVQTGYTERDFTEVAQAVVRPGAVTADVGASMGYFSCLFAAWAGPSGRVLAFEPWPSALSYLRANIRGNRFRNVTVEISALFDRAGPGHMQPPTYRVSPGRGSDPGALDVELARFDELPVLTELKRLDAIKIDIEGAELRALEGMRASILRWQPVLLVEVHPPYLPLYGDSVEQLHAFLAEVGYQHVIVEPGATQDRGHHLVAAPPERLHEIGLVAEGEPATLFTAGSVDDLRIAPGDGISISGSGREASLEFRLPPREVRYALSAGGSLGSPPTDPADRLRPSRQTRLSWTGRVGAEPPVSLWLFQYDERRRVRSRSFPIATGQGEWHFLSSPEATRFRVGLRLAGSGRVEVERLSLEQWP